MFISLIKIKYKNPFNNELDSKLNDLLTGLIYNEK